MQRLFHLLWICRLKEAIASKKETAGGGSEKKKRAPRPCVDASAKPSGRKQCLCVCVRRQRAVANGACVAGLQQSGRLFEIVYGPDPYGQISMGVGGAMGCRAPRGGSAFQESPPPRRTLSLICDCPAR